MISPHCWLFTHCWFNPKHCYNLFTNLVVQNQYPQISHVSQSSSRFLSISLFIRAFILGYRLFCWHLLAIYLSIAVPWCVYSVYILLYLHECLCDVCLYWYNILYIGGSKNNSLENIKCHCLGNKPPEQCSESFVISSRWLVEIGIPIMGDTNPQIHQVV